MHIDASISRNKYRLTGFGVWFCIFSDFDPVKLYMPFCFNFSSRLALTLSISKLCNPTWASCLVKTCICYTNFFIKKPRIDLGLSWFHEQPAVSYRHFHCDYPLRSWPLLIQLFYSPAVLSMMSLRNSICNIYKRLHIKDKYQCCFIWFSRLASCVWFRFQWNTFPNQSITQAIYRIIIDNVLDLGWKIHVNLLHLFGKMC